MPKFRIRIHQSSTVYRVSIDPPTFQALKAAVAACIACDVTDLVLSLNGKDALPESGDASLQSLGICSGDTLWILHPTSCGTPAAQVACIPNLGPSSSPTSTAAATAAVTTPVQERQAPTTSRTVAHTPTRQAPEAVMADAHIDEAMQLCTEISQNDVNAAAEEAVLGGSSCSSQEDEAAAHYQSHAIPKLLQKVMAANQPVGQAALFCAVHAAMLETGFSSVATSQDVHALPRCESTLLRLAYTIKPQHVDQHAQASAVLSIAAVEVVCYPLGQLVIVAGAVTQPQGSGTDTVTVALDPGQILRSTMPLQGTDAPRSPAIWDSFFTDVSSTWITLRDQLCIPLLVQACRALQVPYPTTLLRLPQELLNMCLQHLQAKDVARLCCTCSQLRHAAAGNDVWQQLYVHKFGERAMEEVVARVTAAAARGNEATCSISWMREFIRRWRDVEQARAQRHRRVPPSSPPWWPRMPYNPAPGPLPFTPGLGMVGGDYDRLPNVGLVGMVHPMFGRQGLPGVPGAGRRRGNFRLV